MKQVDGNTFEGLTGGVNRGSRTAPRPMQVTYNCLSLRAVNSMNTAAMAAFALGFDQYCVYRKVV